MQVSDALSVCDPSAGLARFCSSTLTRSAVSHPADVMVSKLNADRKAGESAGAAIGRIYKNIGFSGLWNGLPVRIAMIGTLTAFQWLIYDSFKVYLGVRHALHFSSTYLLHSLTCATASNHRWPLTSDDFISLTNKPGVPVRCCDFPFSLRPGVQKSRTMLYLCIQIRPMMLQTTMLRIPLISARYCRDIQGFDASCWKWQKGTIGVDHWL